MASLQMIVVRNTLENQRTGDFWAKTIVVGGENATCKNCGEKLILSYFEAIHKQYDCPSCNVTNDFQKQN